MTVPRPTVWGDAWRLSVGTLTAVPVPSPSTVDGRRAGGAMMLAPLAVLPLGIAAALVVTIGHALDLPTLVTALLALAAVAAGNRAFHLDGLSDTVDGLAASYDMAPYCFLEDDHTVGIPTVEKVTIGGQRPGLTVDGWVDDQADLVITDEATKWIGDQIADGSPFLAILGTLSPHRPCVPPDEFRGRSNAGNRGDAVTLVDDLLRRVLETIEPVAEDTIVIFTSDNGAPMNYPEDGDTFHHRPNGPWRGQKADIWEAGHRVPLIVAGPGIASGETCSATVSLLDLLPTLLDIDGVANPCGLDGESFAEMLSAPETTEQTSRLLGMQALNGMLALRYGSRKAIFGTGSGGFTELRGEVGFGPDDAGQLYDLSDDPGERHNRWREAHAEARSKLSSFADAAGFDAAEHGPN